MSIIQEALRKAQGSYVENNEPERGKEEKTKGSFDKSPAYTKPDIKAFDKINTKKSNRLPVLVGILLFLFMVYGFMLSAKYSGSNTQAAAPSAVKQTNKLLPSSFPAPKMDQPDLFTSRTPNFSLNGIMYVENRPQAIINGYILEEGDSINGATVLVIEKDCVLLEINSSNVRLELEK